MVNIELHNNIIWIKGSVDFENYTEILNLGKSYIHKISEVNINLSQLKKGNSINIALLLDFLKISKLQKKKVKIHQAPEFLFVLRKLYGLNEVIPFM